jgi:hypothetical protein
LVLCDRIEPQVLLPHLAGVAVERVELTGGGVHMWARARSTTGRVAG